MRKFMMEIHVDHVSVCISVGVYVRRLILGGIERFHVCVLVPIYLMLPKIYENIENRILIEL